MRRPPVSNGVPLLAAITSPEVFTARRPAAQRAARMPGPEGSWRFSSCLMHAVRIVLEEKNAFAIVATHSPVVLQETLARHVRIVRRIGDSFEVLTPDMETFGENVGIRSRLPLSSDPRRK
jgi:hypothetical protein